MTNYPTYNYTTNDWDPKLARCVKLDHPTGYPFDHLHAHNYNEILFFIEGGGTHNMNFKEYSIENNSIHLLGANNLHSVERGLKSYGYALVYQEQLLHQLQNIHRDINFSLLLNLSQIIQLTEDEMKRYLYLFNEVENHQNHSVYQFQMICTIITKIVATHLKPVEKVVIGDDTLIELVKLIELNYKKQLTIKEYAKLLNMSPSNLQTKVSKASNKTIKELQTDRLLKEAKKQIVVSHDSISNIAFELGFSDTSNFTNWFKKHTGKIPSEYKYGD